MKQNHTAHKFPVNPLTLIYLYIMNFAMVRKAVVCPQISQSERPNDQPEFMIASKA